MIVDVELRPLGEGDLETVCRWRNDPEVSRFLAPRVKTHEEAKAWFHRVHGNPNNLVLGIVVDGSLIGYGILEDVNLDSGKCELGIIVGEQSCWGRGIGKTVVAALLEQCFDRLQLHRVLAVIASGNERSVALFDHLGFTHEGTLREATVIDGSRADLLLYSLLKHEYRAALAR